MTRGGERRDGDASGCQEDNCKEGWWLLLLRLWKVAGVPDKYYIWTFWQVQSYYFHFGPFNIFILVLLLYKYYTIVLKNIPYIV